MRLFVERERRTEEIAFSGTVAALLEQLSINPQTVLVMVNDALVTEDETLTGEEDVKILTVVSGG